MDLLLHFRAFVRTAELGGFSAAARDLGSSQPSVSRLVGELEGRVGAALFRRGPTGASLTGEGMALLAPARAALAAADAALAVVGGLRGAIAGRVRLGCGVAFGRLCIVPRLAPLLARHPALSIELAMADEAVDLVLDGVDAAIRVGTVAAPDLVVRRLGLAQRGVFATPEHLARVGVPDRAEALAGLDCVVFTGLATGAVWPFGGGRLVPVRGRFHATATEAIRAGVLAGLGFGLCPLWMFGPEVASGEVIRVLPDDPPLPLPIQVVFPGREAVSARVRAVVEHLAESFSVDAALASDSIHP